MSYATIPEFDTWLGAEYVNDDDALIQSTLDAATRGIDRATGRHFTLETGVTKTYLASSVDRLSVVDLISATSVTVDANGDRSFSRTLDANDYDLYPFVDETGLPAVRFDTIRTRPTSTQGFAPGYLVRVVGDFGYVDENGETPADVKQACLILAARLWKRRETPFGVLSLPDIGTAAQIRRVDPDVANLLDPYTLTSDWVAV